MKTAIRSLLIIILVCGVIGASASAQEFRSASPFPVDEGGVAYLDAFAASINKAAGAQGDTLFYFDLSGDLFFSVMPDPNGEIQALAKRFTPDQAGSLESVLFLFNNRPTGVVGTGTLRISYRTAIENPISNVIPLIPGDILASVDVPFSSLDTGGLNRVNLEATDVSLAEGEDFFLYFEVVNASDDARLEFLLDDGSSDQNDTNYFPPRSVIWADPPGSWFFWTNNLNWLFAAIMNNAPTVVSEIENVTLEQGGKTVQIDLSPVFSDPEGSILQYSARSNNTSIATVSVIGTTMTVTSGQAGITTITVRAEDNKGNETIDQFSVFVQANASPTIQAAIEDQDLTQGGAPFQIDLLNVFSDPEGGVLTFSATTSASGVATATVSGSTLTVTPVGEGEATITASARDDHSNITSDAFKVTVEGSPPPVVQSAIDDQNLIEGGNPFQVNLNTVFSNPGTGSLMFSATTSASGVATATVSGSTLTVTPVGAGNAVITATAQNSGGGSVSDQFSASVQANSPPAISHTPVTSAVAGQDIVITSTITDNSGLAQVTLSYAQGGNHAGGTATMTSTGDNTYEASIPAGSVTSRGVEYSIKAQDMQGLTTEEGPFYTRVQVEGTGLSRSISVAGTAENAYRLVSVPLDLTNKSTSSILVDDLGTYDNTKWRFFGLSPNQNYDEFPSGSAASMQPGKAYWLAVSESGKQWNTGPGQSITTGKAHTVTLSPGWNFVATPFHFDISRSFISLASEATLDMRSFNGSWSSFSGSLRPFEGYALAANATDQLLIYPNAFPGAAAKKTVDDAAIAEVEGKTIEDAFAWSIQILAQAGQAQDHDNVAGVSDKASHDWDDLDRPEPPVIGDYVSVYFPHPEWQTPFKAYNTDVRPEPQDHEAWEFEVKTNVSSMVSLRFEGLEDLPITFDAWLHDEAAQVWHNLRERPHYTLAGSNERNPNRFTLMVGRAEVLEAFTVQEVPGEFELQNYPNPFNPQTTIRFGLPHEERVTLSIYNVLGEKVVSLLTQEEKTAGYHTVVWDGRSEAGVPVASGIYIYTLQTSQTRLSERMLLMK